MKQRRLGDHIPPVAIVASIPAVLYCFLLSIFEWIFVSKQWVPWKMIICLRRCLFDHGWKLGSTNLPGSLSSLCALICRLLASCSISCLDFHQVVCLLSSVVQICTLTRIFVFGWYNWFWIVACSFRSFRSEKFLGCFCFRVILLVLLRCGFSSFILGSDPDRLLSLQSPPCDKVGEVYCVLAFYWVLLSRSLVKMLHYGRIITNGEFLSRDNTFDKISDEMKTILRGRIWICFWGNSLFGRCRCTVPALPCFCQSHLW